MHNFLGINYKVDNFRKGFFLDPYDEPTFLTFAIDFKFEGAPVTAVPDHDLWGSPFFEERGNGAIDFLINRGYGNEAGGIKVFKEILRYLTFDAPWYFQSISGLDSLWKGATDISGANKSKGATLTIDTLEAVDLRITELASIYRTAIFDKQFMRERIPDNLRWFSMDVYVAEARNLRYTIPGVGQAIANQFGLNTGVVSAAANIARSAVGLTSAARNIDGLANFSDKVTDLLNQFGYVKFKCRQCEFDFSSSWAGGQSLEVTTKNTPAKNSFKINIGYFEEESRYADGSRLYDDLIKSDLKNPWKAKNIGADVQNASSFLSGLPRIGNSIEEAGQKAQNALASIGGLINPALGAASQFLNPPINDLGNVYGN